MKINLETDYAVRIVQCLADTGKRLDANAISEKTGVTQRFSLKIRSQQSALQVLTLVFLTARWVTAK